MPVKKIKSIALAEACKPPKDYNMRKDGITQSLAGSFLNCPLRGMLKVNRWSLPEQSVNTRFGSMFHDTLDKIYSAKTMPTMPVIEAHLDDYLCKHNSEWGNTDVKAEFDAAIASALFEGYIKFWKADFTEKKFQNVEQSLSVEYAGFLCRCKIDGEFKSKTGSTWLMEHKTKSRIDEETLLMKITFDFQNMFYKHLWQLANDNRPIVGTLYNVVRKPQHKQGKLESIKDFRQRLFTEIMKDPKHYFKRYELAYSEKDDVRFRVELVSKFLYIEGFVTGKAQVYRNEFACECPYKCEFLPACSSGSMNGYIQRPKLFEELEEAE
jgi:PD-(D/E)XK nuclease superfamily